MEEMGETVTGFYQMGLAFADISRIGNELVLTAKDPIDMITATLGPFAPITSSLNCSIKSTVAFAQPLQKVISEKHSPVFSFYNGCAGDITINLDKDLVNKISALTGMDQTQSGQIAHIAYRMFNKLEIDVATDDVTTLPQAFQDAINGGGLIKQALDQVIEPLKMFTSQSSQVISQLSSLYGVNGPIYTYFPISDLGALRMTSYSQDFWQAFTNLMQVIQAI